MQGAKGHDIVVHVPLLIVYQLLFKPCACILTLDQFLLKSCSFGGLSCSLALSYQHITALLLLLSAFAYSRQANVSKANGV